MTLDIKRCVVVSQGQGRVSKIHTLNFIEFEFSDAELRKPIVMMKKSKVNTTDIAFGMVQSRVRENDTEGEEPKRIRFDKEAVVSMVRSLMSNANAAPFLRKGRFEDCQDKPYLEDVISWVEEGRHQDIDEVFSGIYKVLKMERDGNEILIEDQEKQEYDEADALIMAGKMMKTVKSLRKEIKDVLKVFEQYEDEEDDEMLENSSDCLQKKLKKQFEFIPDDHLHGEAVKMMFVEGRHNVMRDLERMDHVYKQVDKPTIDVVKIEEEDAIYKQMSDHFKKNLASREEDEKCEIENIFKINNNFISYVYNDASYEMERKLGEKPIEELLFHGTSDEAIAGIIKNNFDADASPTDTDTTTGYVRPKGSQYGKGIYFCSSSATASKYGNNILVCKVILGNCETFSPEKMREKMKARQGGSQKWFNVNREISAEYDSRKVETSKGVNVYVIKETDHILPYCVITTKNKNLCWAKSKFLRAKSRMASSLLARSSSGNAAQPLTPPPAPSSGQSGPTTPCSAPDDASL